MQSKEVIQLFLTVESLGSVTCLALSLIEILVKLKLVVIKFLEFFLKLGFCSASKFKFFRKISNIHMSI